MTSPGNPGEYIATFYTHHAALVTQRAMAKAGLKARMMPVPRALSSSCGTCVGYVADSPCLHLIHQDMEQVVRVRGEAYEVIVNQA